MIDLYLNVNSLADSVKTWVDPIANEVAMAAVQEVKGQIVSNIIWFIFATIVLTVCSIIFYRLHVAANKDDEDAGDYDGRWALILPIILSAIFMFVSLTEAIQMSYAPKYQAIENIMQLKRLSK